MNFLIFLFIVSYCNIVFCSYLPIVLWHGMGDACCFPFSLGKIQRKLKETLPGVYVLSLKVGNSIAEDVQNGYFLHPNKQIEMVCEMIKNDPQLKDGYNAIGFSQGSQFLRGLIQRCPSPKVKTLVSLGGQHQGVYGIPNCSSLSHVACDYIRKALNHAAYDSFLQEHLVQATYWHDPLNEDEYKKYSSFLSDINNEEAVNQTYIASLQSLENFVLVKFEKDTMVQPVESEWFGFYKPGQSKVVESLNESDLYIQDRLGLQQMDQDGKLKFLSLPGNHLEFEWEWFVKNIINIYF